MSPQEAVEAPRLSSTHYHNSVGYHEFTAGQVSLEGRIPAPHTAAVRPGARVSCGRRIGATHPPRRSSINRQGAERRGDPRRARFVFGRYAIIREFLVRYPEWCASLRIRSDAGARSGEETTLVGGQAVIEGVMMRAPHSYCVAVRKPSGELVTEEQPIPRMSEKYPLFKYPILRGLGTLGRL